MTSGFKLTYCPAFVSSRLSTNRPTVLSYVPNSSDCRSTSRADRLPVRSCSTGDHGIKVCHLPNLSCTSCTDREPRFPSRDSARNNLFSGYDARKASSRPTSTSPAPGANGGRPSYSHAYNNAASNSHPPSGRTSSEQLGGQPQYNQAMLEQLESQNDGGLSEMSKKVSMLKDVSHLTNQKPLC